MSEIKGKKIIAAGPNFPWVERFGAILVTTTLPTAYNALATGVASGDGAGGAAGVGGLAGCAAAVTER